MSFWNTFEKAKAQPKPSFIRITDIIELANKETDFSADEHTSVRFLGSIFGTSTINVPIIKEGRFFRKKDTNNLIALPKQVIGYDYKSKHLDESKCPYLQYVNLNSDALLVATINYVKESNIKDKEYLLSALENNGLSNAWWNDKKGREIINSSRELSMLLSSIASRGTKEYYSNILIYPTNGSYTQAAINAYTDFSIRTLSEKTPVDFLDYTTAYGEQVYLKESKTSAAPTPVKVIKITNGNLATIFSDIVKLNTVTINKETREKEMKGIEDPQFGCEVSIRLEQTPFRTPAGKATYSYVFTRGEKQELTENEKKYLLWDLRKLQAMETYDEALTFLTDMGYCGKAQASKVVSFDSPAQTPTPAVVTPTPANNVAPQVDTLPWTEDSTPANPVVAPEVQPVVQATPAVESAAVVTETPKEKPVKKMVQAKPADDFDSIFS